MRNRNSIIMKTIYRVLRVSICTFLILTTISTAYTSIYMKNKILEAQRIQLRNDADSLNNHFTSLIECMIALSEYTPTHRLITSYHELYSKEWIEDVRNVDDYLGNVNMFTDYLVDVALLDDKKETVYCLNDILKSDYPYGDQAWFEEAMEQDSQVKYAVTDSQDHLYEKYENPVFSMIYPIHGKTGLKGYILMECDLIKMADVLKKKNQYSNYRVWDSDGDVIYTTTQADLEEKGSRYYMLSEDLEVNQWRLGQFVDRSRLLYPVYRLIVSMGVIGILIILFLSAVAITSGRNVENAFLKLISRISSYEGGKAESIEEYKDAPYEIAAIADSFEGMAKKMNHLIEEVYLLNINQKEAELEALINQINPHFLYNVFQLIQTKAILSENREIEDMIQSLSQMLRYTMERKRERVTVKEELDYIKNYLGFYKERFPKLFTWDIICDSGYENYRIIKFILQPVVENCFKHAFKERKSGYFIRIRVEEEADTLCFSVEDNGAGIEAEKLTDIRKQLEEDHSIGGIGVVNTNERIHLAYGKQYGIRIESVVHEYTKVTIRCKKETEQDV